MMEIIIDGKRAALKKGASFDYVSENRMFSGSDDFSLSIALPLAGCPQNLEIFGDICRPDVTARRVRFDCEIRSADFCRFGTATVTEINDSEVKVQFLAGRSEQNFDNTFDEVYINELDLGGPKILTVAAAGDVPEKVWDPSENDFEAVALPWVNNESGRIQNCVEYSGGRYVWSADTKYLSWQPYLLFITKRICEAVGYGCDLSAWEEKDEFRFILMCNCLPQAWDVREYARALPHWSVDEYFEKLELFLRGEFTIDHRTKKISFAFTADVVESCAPVRLEKVVSEFSSQIDDQKGNCDYIEAKNLVYKDCDFRMWKYYSCDWFVKSRSEMKNMLVSYDRLSDLMSQNKGLRLFMSAEGNHRGDGAKGDNFVKLLYAKDVDMYFVIRAVDRRSVSVPGSISKYQYRCVVQPVNLFGGKIVNRDEDSDKTEIEFVPANIDFTEEKYGDALFLQPSGFSESGPAGYQGDPDDDWQEEFCGTAAQRSIEAGEPDKPSEYYNEIFVGYWDGTTNFAGRIPHPLVQNIMISGNWDGFSMLPFNLRLNDAKNHERRTLREVNTKIKYTFRFLADSIPDVRALFFIRGKRYVCEKITATFTESGMSQLMKGEFWPLLEED